MYTVHGKPNIWSDIHSVRRQDNCPSVLGSTNVSLYSDNNSYNGLILQVTPTNSCYMSNTVPMWIDAAYETYRDIIFTGMVKYQLIPDPL